MDSCPKCGGQLQVTEHLDQDDKVIERTVRCVRKNKYQKKKGCGFSQIIA